MPENWIPSTRTVRKLADELSISPANLLDSYLEGFRTLCASRGLLYRRWTIAFMNCVRNDWLELRND